VTWAGALDVGPAHASLEVIGAEGELTAHGVPPDVATASVLIDSLDPTATLVTLGGAANGAQPGGSCWEGSFSYLATLGGSGVVRHGVTRGGLELGVSADPVALALKADLPVDCIAELPLHNRWGSSGTGSLRLRFSDTATVHAEGMLDGMPVELPVAFAIQSVGTLTGRAEGIDNSVLVTFEGRVRDTITSQHRSALLLGTTRSEGNLETAVGRSLEIEGLLEFDVSAVAGGTDANSEFYPLVEARAQVDWAGLSIGTPPGVTLVADSGTDYSVPVPEPGPWSAGLAAGAALVASRAARRRTEHGRFGEPGASSVTERVAALQRP
jgi:hypothetical protein